VPGVRIAVFSTGKRASGSMMGIIKDFLKRVPNWQSMIVKENSEELFLQVAGRSVKTKRKTDNENEDDNKVSKLYSFPSSVTGNEHFCCCMHTHTSFVLDLAWFRVGFREKKQKVKLTSNVHLKNEVVRTYNPLFSKKTTQAKQQ
jgi:hypothetical protein